MNKYSVSIICGGALWGFMGVFTRQMTQLGFSSPNTVFIRSIIASILFGATILFCDKKLFRFKLRDFWCFFGSGVCSLLFFTVCYFKAIELTSLSTAAILLYTAPSLVMLMSLVFFGEKMTKRKLLALVMAFVGCCLVSGLGGDTRLTIEGLIYGLCAGLGYALYSIFARFAMLRGYSSLTVNFYSSLLAFLGTGFIWGFAQPMQLMFSSTKALILCLLLGITISYLPYLLYTYGLTKTENGKASVMASVEPVVATLLGIIVFREKITPVSAIGIACVLGAIVVLNLRKAEVQNVQN